MQVSHCVSDLCETIDSSLRWLIWNKGKLWAIKKKYCMCLGVCQRDCERVLFLFVFFNSFFTLSLQGTVIARFISQVSHSMSFFKLLKKPFTWWWVHKPQRARLWLLYPIAYLSFEHALDLNAERQCKLLPSDSSQDVQASLPFLCCYEAWNLIFCGVCTQTTASTTHSKSTLGFLEGQATFALWQ